MIATAYDTCQQQSRAHPALVAEHWLVIESACRSWLTDSMLAALWAKSIGAATVLTLPPWSTDADAAAAGDGVGRAQKVTVRCGDSPSGSFF